MKQYDVSILINKLNELGFSTNEDQGGQYIPDTSFTSWHILSPSIYVLYIDYVFPVVILNPEHYIKAISQTFEQFNIDMYSLS